MQRTNYWICVTSPTNWTKIKDSLTWGVPRNQRSYNQIRKAKLDDILLFYIKSPIKAFVAIYRVASEKFVEEEDSEPWTNTSYPYRLSIKPFYENVVPFETFLPLREILNKLRSVKGYASLQGKAMIPIPQRDFILIKSLLEKKNDFKKTGKL